MSVVALHPTNFHVCPAAEILRPGLADLWIPREKLLYLRRAFDVLLMASGKSAYLGSQVKNSVLGAVAFAPVSVTPVFPAMWTTAAATDMDGYVGNTAGEVSGGSYDRVSKTNNTANFATIVGDAAKVNTTAITWPTASANWNSSAVIPQFAIFDANAKSAADNLLIWGDFTTAKAVLNGDTAQINASSMSWTEE